MEKGLFKGTLWTEGRGGLFVIDGGVCVRDVSLLLPHEEPCPHVTGLVSFTWRGTSGANKSVEAFWWCWSMPIYVWNDGVQPGHAGF